MNFCFKYRPFSILFVLMGLLMTGCNDTAEIHSYQTPKEEDVYAENHSDDSPRPERMAPALPDQPSTSAQHAGPARMFAAMIPMGDRNWYYKMTGPVDAVAEKVEQMTKFISSVTYSQDEPVWTLPEGWTQKPGNSIRFATLVIPSESGPLEMSVTLLSGVGDETSQVVDNVNRWRGQLGLGGISAEDVNNASSDPAAELSLKKVEDQAIYFVNIVGQQQPGGMSPPFAR